ncbi:MAG: hypothetical protein KAJ10_16750, partial [Thermodesulfovibrionia bacterium]|nr:hypothetical protein [Thermodesulfovibrionia bacterium]
MTNRLYPPRRNNQLQQNLPARTAAIPAAKHVIPYTCGKHNENYCARFAFPEGQTLNCPITSTWGELKGWLKKYAYHCDWSTFDHLWRDRD